MRVLIFGLGSIGMRYARLLQGIGEHQLYAFRSNSTSQNPMGIPEVFDWDSVDTIKPEVAFITNPTSLHVKTALACAKRGMALFIEKPIDSTLSNLDDLIGIVRQRNLATYVAYVLRFHPALQAMRTYLRNKKVLHARVQCTSYLPEWREGVDSKLTYSARKDLGGGVILDVSHEFDYIRYLFGEITSIEGHAAKLSHVTQDAEDVMDATVKCGSVFLNMHINVFSRHVERRIQVDTEDGYCEADLVFNRFLCRSIDGQEEQVYSIGRDDLFRDQLAYFFGNIHNPTMMNNLENAAVLFRTLVHFRERVWA